MGAIALARPLHTPPAGPRTRSLRLAHEARSLGEHAELLWAGLQANAPVACPICDGRMEPRYSATGVVGGRCRSCGTELD